MFVFQSLLKFIVVRNDDETFHNHYVLSQRNIRNEKINKSRLLESKKSLSFDRGLLKIAFSSAVPTFCL